METEHQGKRLAGAWHTVRGIVTVTLLLLRAQSVTGGPDCGGDTQASRPGRPGAGRRTAGAVEEMKQGWGGVHVACSA